jgi:hypothetical protein
MSGINLIDTSSRFKIHLYRYRKRDNTTIEVQPKTLKILDMTASLFQCELPDDISIEPGDIFYTSLEVFP